MHPVVPGAGPGSGGYSSWALWDDTCQGSDPGEQPSRQTPKRWCFLSAPIFRAGPALGAQREAVCGVGASSSSLVTMKNEFTFCPDDFCRRRAHRGRKRGREVPCLD